MFLSLVSFIHSLPLITLANSFEPLMLPHKNAYPSNTIIGDYHIILEGWSIYHLRIHINFSSFPNLQQFLLSQYFILNYLV